MADMIGSRRLPHGGYPTPRAAAAPERRRRESMRLFGYPGAHVEESASSAMFWAGYGYAAAETNERWRRGSVAASKDE